MNKKFWFFTAGLWMACTQIWAQPAKASPIDFQTTLWAASCMACHGTDGKAEGTGMTIGGRNVDELYNNLVAYKTGKKTGTVMHQHARGYSDEQLKRIAEYFSRIK